MNNLHNIPPEKVLFSLEEKNAMRWLYDVGYRHFRKQENGLWSFYLHNNSTTPNFRDMYLIDFAGNAGPGNSPFDPAWVLP